MLKFKDEAGNFTSPKKGDYVLASDIKDEAVHNRVRDAFKPICRVSYDLGLYGASEYACYCVNEYGEFWSEGLCRSTHQKRRIIPTQQTLFEAACAAKDGTRFKVGEAEFKVYHGSLMWIDPDGDELRPALLSVLGATNWEYVPDGPEKFKLIADKIAGDLSKATKLMHELCKWEGAQIGKLIQDINRATIYIPVEYDSYEQCHAATQSECPHAPSIDMLGAK